MRRPRSRGAFSLTLRATYATLAGMIRFFFGLTAVLGLCSASAAQAEPLVLKASSPWNLDYAKDSCRLTRAFGEGKQQVFLIFDRYEPSSQLDISVIGKPMATGSDVHIPVTAGFGPDLPAPARASVLVGDIGPDRLPMLFIGRRDLRNIEHSETPLTVEDEARVTEFTVRTPLRTVVLQTGSLKAPMAAMRACTDDLLEQWGLKPTEQAHLTTPPIPTSNPGQWLRSNDYPRSPLLMGASAIVHFRLMIDPAGKPSGCNVQQATNSPEFTGLTCQLLLKRAQFTPAHDAAGNAIASYYTNSVRWVVGGL